MALLAATAARVVPAAQLRPALLVPVEPAEPQVLVATAAPASTA
jgi:hypothetical protein